ncbi:YjbH domain-containing protein [Tropicimonas isoalkanivorans]|uniref:Exopolysaccharide biosynthesis protein YbjH n=1 Tax=Tropicimonas isoalkanivorans TaxID=441112 RepID=A0A1I1L3Z9_9RHOB|nr:YjbH domain-containing protein [Tropicimonas isoalkanivorans]SFC65718.1 Exopolysaccharide biosynthesis protein YbjH [Tropicimonas isoalkanivorans]
MPEQHRKLAGRAIVSAAVIVGTAYPLGGFAEPLVTDSYNLYGVPGLLEMPTAESAADAEFSGNFNWVDEQFRSALTFQFAPRLSGTFRYAKVPEFVDYGEDYYDRSFDLRFQFLDESIWLPAVAIGFNDFIGTGIYSAEYLVATKTFRDSLRVTGGLGWGRLGTYEPLTDGSERKTDRVDTGGSFNFDRFFTGPMAAFGGVSWAPTDQLTLKAEYSSDAYTREMRRGLVDHTSPWNFGAEYRINEGVSLQAAYLYGDTYGLQLNFTMNPKAPLFGPGNEPAPLPVRPRPPRSVDPEAWNLEWTAATPAQQDQFNTRLKEALAKEGISLEAIDLKPHSVEIQIENNRYYPYAEAVGRISRILTRAMPESVETFSIVATDDGVPYSRVSLSRTDLERLENAPSDAILARTQFSEALRFAPPENRVGDPFPRFTWYMAPYIDYSLFDPDNPLRADLGVGVGADVILAPGLILSGDVRQRLVGNLDDVDRRSTSELPRVRSNSSLYNQTDTYLKNLTLAHFGRPSGEWYSRVTAGYLEQMYAGISGELLWKPVDSRLALGSELNYTVQREFDGGFGLQDYDVWTGYLSAYYDFENGYYGQIDAGRFLAGDYGATFTASRQFDNGWEVGAFATFTDVPFEEFGEGSFDKGVFLKIPLYWASGQPSRAGYGLKIRPLTRDGGARVSVPDRLYDTVREWHESDFEDSGGRFWR